VRVYISGATVLIVTVLTGVLIGPEVHAEGTGHSAAVALTAPATTTPSATGTTSPSTGSTAKPLVSASPAPAPVPTFNPSLPVTVALGDSITYKPDSWVRQICAAEVVVQNCVNAGISGNTTTQMLARLDSDVLAYNPAIMLLMGGTNDLKQHQSTKKILHRLDIILDRAQAAGALTVLCTIPPRNHYGKQVLSVNKAIRKYASRGNVPLLDFYSLLGTKTGIYKRGLTRDGTHPNRVGFDLMTELAEQRLPALLHPIKEAAAPGGLNR
jgi:lysophospholipase L1-like esterase